MARSAAIFLVVATLAALRMCWMRIRAVVIIPLLLVGTVFDRAYGQEPSAAIDSYKCSDFLSDIAKPADGAGLLRSLMMVGWAAGYASGYQRNDSPRADPKSVQMIAAVLGDACRRDPSATAVQALVGSLRDFSKSGAKRP